ncbi:ATP-binding protein [Streptomyces sp. NPDC093252]|uniref:ATP-binding protein n=1 Tax=Streptomyces sp. NPDC093252 TaxID=3154980 RepID=UPI00341D1B71
MSPHPPPRFVSEHLVLDIVAVPRAVPEARRVVGAYLGDPCPDVLLCLSELLTNVIRHVGEGTPVTVRVCPGPSGTTRLEVTDAGPPALLLARYPHRYDESGRGLLLVGVIARRWGVKAQAGGRTVWCELVADEPSVSGRSAASP